MIPIPRMKALLLSFLVLAAASGCAPKVQERIFWPPPPNQPRLEWMNVYHSEADFPKSRGEAAARAFLGEEGTFVLSRPTGIVSNGKGRVYVSDNVLDEVKIFDMNQKKVTTLTQSRAFQDPLGMDLDAEGRLYVADGGRRAVLVFSSDDRPLYQIGDEKTLEKPAFVAVNDRLQRVYVSDAKAHRLSVYNFKGDHLFFIGEPGNSNGKFFAPQGVAVDREGRVFVADMFNFRIQVFDPDGRFLNTFGAQGDQAWNFELPKDISIDSEGNLWIVDSRKAAILTYTPDGKLLLATGMGRTNHALGFSLPSAIHVDSSDRIFVTDQILLRFTEWQYLSEKYVKENPIDEQLLESQKEKMRRVQESEKADR